MKKRCERESRKILFARPQQKIFENGEKFFAESRKRSRNVISMGVLTGHENSAIEMKKICAVPKKFLRAREKNFRKFFFDSRNFFKRARTCKNIFFRKNIFFAQNSLFCSKRHPFSKFWKFFSLFYFCDHFLFFRWKTIEKFSFWSDRAKKNYFFRKNSKNGHFCTFTLIRPWSPQNPRIEGFSEGDLQKWSNFEIFSRISTLFKNGANLEFFSHHFFHFGQNWSIRAKARLFFEQIEQENPKMTKVKKSEKNFAEMRKNIFFEIFYFFENLQNRNFILIEALT